ncbi:hypothetical protein [Halopelagius fulvigenes]|uniref:Uncharacterized protein n=1 Tax=Halopelagius fulvigenes TaxID=1198324 RepID=A0ABD5TYY4_9EURY
MTELELLLWFFASALLAGGVAVLLVASVFAVAAARLTRAASAVLAPTSTADPAAIRDVEAHLADLRNAPRIDSGVIRRVVPEARRGAGDSRFGRRSGVRFDVALPLESPEDRVASVWVPTPNHLTGETELERVAAACGVEPSRLSDAVGRELPLTYAGDGQWVIRSPSNDAAAAGPETELA